MTRTMTATMLLLSLVGCETDAPGSEASRPEGAAAGKADDAEPTAPADCPYRGKLLDDFERRATLNAGGIAGEFDLDQDGVDDLLVESLGGALGSPYLSAGTGCPSVFSGYVFEPRSLSPHRDDWANEGVLDLALDHAEGCDRSFERYRFDGRRYEREERSRIDICECDERTLTVAARDGSTLYEASEFVGQPAFEFVGDLDGDGTTDVIARPGIRFPDESELLTVLISEGDSCANVVAGEFVGAHVGLVDSGGDGMEIDVFAAASCEDRVERYVFDGEEFVFAGSRTAAAPSSVVDCE